MSVVGRVLLGAMVLLLGVLFGLVLADFVFDVDWSR